MAYHENRIYLMVLFLFLFGFSPSATQNSPPLQAVEKLIHSISSLKNNSDLSSKELKVNQELSYNALALFDLKEISRKVLGKHWSKRTPKEKEEFVELLGQMFIKEVFPSSGKFFSSLKLVFGKTKMKEPTAHIPLTVVHDEEGEIGIEFHLHQNQGKWQLVDIDLDEISMRSNLRSKVYKIILKNNYQELIHRMKQKLKEIDNQI